MQVSDHLTALFYHTWFHVQYSKWCEIVFDRGDTMNAVSFRFSTTSSMYGVVSYILIYREDMHNILVLRNWMPIIISLLPKNAWFIEKCCTSGALGWRRRKSGGDIHLISPNHWSPSHVSIWHFDIMREIRGKFPCGIILGDSIGKRGEISTEIILLYLSWISAGKFPRGWSPGILHESAWKSGGRGCWEYTWLTNYCYWRPILKTGLLAHSWGLSWFITMSSLFWKSHLIGFCTWRIDGILNLQQQRLGYSQNLYWKIVTQFFMY